MGVSDDIRFGRFQLHRRGRRLLADGALVELGTRAFDILLALIDADGAPVSKEDLLKRGWPNLFIEEENLRVQIHTLRAALGADAGLVRTVARRGYAFVGEVSPVNAPPKRLNDANPDKRRTNIPSSVESLIGREDELRELAELSADGRLLTVVGPGGIGKTRLALALAQERLPKFADGVWLVELSAIVDPALAPVAASTSVGIEFGGGEITAQRFAQAVADREILLILDNCEHVLHAAASLAEAVLRTVPAARVLATSREPLRAEGEQLYFAPPLAMAPEDAEDPSSYAAVELFLAKARAAGARLVHDPQTSAAVATICRRLDGIPLAIELAAARAAILSVEFLVSRLDDRFALLTGGRRTALPRQQTLKATLDWSYSLLTEVERKVFKRCSIFAGGFDAEAAGAIIKCGVIGPAEAEEAVYALAAKSLMSLQSATPGSGYRLLETTRAYAHELLLESGEYGVVARRHADHYRSLLESTEPLPQDEDPDSLTSQAIHIDNIRSALAWAFATNDERETATALAAAATPLFLELSLLSECRDWARQALDRLSESDRSTRREMILQAGVGVATISTMGNANDGLRALHRALALAEQLQDAVFQMRLLEVLFVVGLRMGDSRGRFALARRAANIYATLEDPLRGPSVEWMLGLAHHFVGDTAEAQTHLDRFVVSMPSTRPRGEARRYGVNSRVNALCALARVMWLGGQVEAALGMCQDVVAEARQHGGVIAQSIALSWTIPVHLWRGDKNIAAELIEDLISLSRRHSLGPRLAVGIGLKGALTILDGQAEHGTELLRGCLSSLGSTNHHILGIELLAHYAEGQAATNSLAQALATVDSGIERTVRTGEAMYLPELLRIKGEILIRSGEGDGGEALLVEALRKAQAQPALSLALRAAMSLARRKMSLNSHDEAAQILTSVHIRFTNGFETADLEAAALLLSRLRGPELAGRACPSGY